MGTNLLFILLWGAQESTFRIIRNCLLKKGDLVLQTSIGSDGLFLGGPLYDDTEYYFEASKGYHLKALSWDPF